MSAKTPAVQAPQLFVSTKESAEINLFLKQSGRKMNELAEQNLALLDENHSLREKLSQAERRDDLYKVAEQYVKCGVFTDRQIRVKVSQWLESGKPASHFQEMLQVHRNPSTVDTDFSESGLDGGKSSRHTEKTSGSRTGSAYDYIEAQDRALRAL